MDTQDKEKFKLLMIGSGEIYGKEITKPLMQIYFQSLQKYSIEQVSDAFSKHLCDEKSGTFMPKPADIIRHLKANDVTAENKAELAWMQVMNSISSVGSYGTLKLDDKQAMAAVRNMGSWIGLCQTNESDMQWKKKEFIANYMTFENTPTEMLPASLPGISEMHNQKLESKKQLQGIASGVEYIRQNLIGNKK